MKRLTTYQCLVLLVTTGLANPTNETDDMEVHYRTERGFEGFASNRFVLLERV